jgi:predicted glutamine amidotransferase
MCRFVAYHGPPIQLDELLYKPDHSIINQSTNAQEREEPLNGDGWGVGWYNPDMSPEPAVYREVRPAWNDENMRRVSPVVETPLYFAHVRAASPGLAVHQLNCHPFPGGQYTLEDSRHRGPIEEGRQELMFMHNGGLGAYADVIRRLRSELDEETFLGIRGSTDSEHAFALVQETLGEDVIDPDVDDLGRALRESLTTLERLKHEHGDPSATTWANFCLTDGESIAATRYVSPEDASAQTLYVGEAGTFVSDGEFAGTPDPDGDAATIVASEPLFEDDRVWQSVPRNHLVTVAPDGETSVEPLDLDIPAVNPAG